VQVAITYSGECIKFAISDYASHLEDVINIGIEAGHFDIDPDDVVSPN